MKQTQNLSLEQMLDKMVLSSPPSVLVKVRRLGMENHESFVNVNHINENYEIVQPEEYKVYYSEQNTTIQPL